MMAGIESGCTRIRWRLARSTLKPEVLQLGEAKDGRHGKELRRSGRIL